MVVASLDVYLTCLPGVGSLSSTRSTSEFFQTHFLWPLHVFRFWDTIWADISSDVDYSEMGKCIWLHTDLVAVFFTRLGMQPLVCLGKTLLVPLNLSTIPSQSVFTEWLGLLSLDILDWEDEASTAVCSVKWVFVIAFWFATWVKSSRR